MVWRVGGGASESVLLRKRFKIKEQSSNHHTSRFDYAFYDEFDVLTSYMHFTMHNYDLFVTQKRLQKSCLGKMLFKLLLKIVSVTM